MIRFGNIGGNAAMGGGGSAVGGGGNSWSNPTDFTAAITNGTKTITITQLPFTLVKQYVVNGSIKKMSSAGVVTTVPLTTVTVSAGVITLADADDFVTGDEVAVILNGPYKAYDKKGNAIVVTVLNPNHAHYTSVEPLIDESDLGIDGVHDGGDDKATFTDTGEVYTAASVAEGYRIYNVTGQCDALINADTLEGHAGDGGAGDPTDDDINHAALAGGPSDNDWDDGDGASIPEVKRFEIPIEGFNFDTIQVFLDSQDEHNSCYLKFYGTLFSEATTDDTIWWEDLTEEVFSVATVTADGIGDAGRAVTLALGVIDLATPMLKFMVEIVAECDDGNQNNEFKVRIKKAS
jgi:hypothetical protein